MTPEEIQGLTAKLESQAADLFKKQNEKVEVQIAEMKKLTTEKVEAALEEAKKGKLSPEEGDAKIKSAMDEFGKKATTLEEAMRKQGEELNGLKETIQVTPKSMKSISDLVKENAPKLKEMHKNGSGFIKIDMKAAAVTSVANAVSPMTVNPVSPYAPGIGGAPLTVYDILRNPLFVSSYVNTGRTSESRIAWINETSLLGLPAITAEGSQKPLTQRTFQVEFSQAKKVASYIQITEEFDKDLDYLSSNVQRLLSMDVLRAYDDQIQTDVIANATPFSFLANSLGNASMQGFKGTIFDASYWDALVAMQTQVRLANFLPNVTLCNPVLWAKMMMWKDTLGRYNYPAPEVMNALNIKQGNKLAVDYALVGDLQQFNVDIYEDFVIKMGWINDDFIRNQFTVVAEVRFHDYISAARKVGIVYGDSKYIGEQMYSAATNILSGS